ncbi:hypothetical protein P3T76_015360 [Phytophthora citrophthora]|uniref:Uncharacterized protein n=1 Tax=Phytophthora citrophthora TaxID=4793 RepID=A0AAD9G033_9STRA|nr:hypothetical protein P3T76_015360 [Phytophthora citrophthora]
MYIIRHDATRYLHLVRAVARMHASFPERTFATVYVTFVTNGNTWLGRELNTLKIEGSIPSSDIFLSFCHVALYRLFRATNAATVRAMSYELWAMGYEL